MNKLLCKKLFPVSLVALLSINPLSFNIAIALVFAPSLQGKSTEILTAAEIELPPEVQSAVLEAAASRTSQTVSQLTIIEAQPRKWSDSCLGLAKPDELCPQVITPGWQVVVTDGRRNRTYRTDDTGDRIELEEAPQSKL